MPPLHDFDDEWSGVAEARRVPPPRRNDTPALAPTNCVTRTRPVTVRTPSFGSLANGRVKRWTSDEGVAAGESLQFASRQRFLRGGRSEAPRELRPRTDAELSVHAGEGRFDRLRRDVELRSDLGISQSLAGQLGDARLSRRQLVAGTATTAERRPSASTRATRADCGSQRRSPSPRPSVAAASRRRPSAGGSLQPREACDRSSGQSRRSCSASARSKLRGPPRSRRAPRR